MLEEGLTERLHLLWGDRALLPLAFRYLSKYLLMFPRADFKGSIICRLSLCTMSGVVISKDLDPAPQPLGSLVLRPRGQLCITALWWTGRGQLGLSPGLIPEPPLTYPRKCRGLHPAGTDGKGSRPVPGSWGVQAIEHSRKH